MLRPSRKVAADAVVCHDSRNAGLPVKTISALGSFRGSINNLALPPGMVAEDDEVFDDIDDEDSFDTDAATRGSEPLGVNGLGMSFAGSHSTMVIKSPHASAIKAADSEEALAGR